MHSSNPAQLFRLVFLFSVCLSFTASCGFWSKANENSNTAGKTDFTPREIPSEIPFSNKEPDNFQTEIIVSTFTANGEKSERKTFLARSGEKRLTIFGAGEKAETWIFQIDRNRSFSIYPEKKIFTETVAGQSITVSGAGGEGESFSDFFAAARLNVKASSSFENAGTENGLSKFLVRLNNSNASEIVIYVDENLKLPVRQEFYSRAGASENGQKALLYAVELRSLQLRADENLFDLPPKDFRKVTKEEFDKIIRQE